MKNQTLVLLRGERTQDHVATDLKIRQSAYSQYENLKRFPQPDIAERMADYFKVPIEEILKSFFSAKNITDCDAGGTTSRGGGVQCGQ